VGIAVQFHISPFFDRDVVLGLDPWLSSPRGQNWRVTGHYSDGRYSDRPTLRLIVSVQCVHITHPKPLFWRHGPA